MRGGLSVKYRRGLQRLRSIASLGSIKRKLLLCFLLAFALHALSRRASLFMGWTTPSSYPHTFLSPSVKGYTVLMNTWKRYDLLKKSISHYSLCSGVDSIHVVWSEPDPPSESLTGFLNDVVRSNSRSSRPVELVFDINEEDSLNNRFKEIKGLKTDAVFSIDDDVIFPCSTVEFAFSVWQTAQDAMVGFVPRAHWVDQLGSKDYYKYGGWWSVWWTGTYSMVLTKAAFLHKKYLTLYTYRMPASIREYITKNRNCEDVAMSFLVANATGAAPIWVKGKINEIGSTGISSLGGHSERRTLCVNRFVAEYGHMPLVHTHLKAVDSRNEWFW